MTLKAKEGTSLVVQWLRLCAPNAGGTTKTRHSQNKLIFFLKQKGGGMEGKKQ